jgi:hypothetical protein
LNNQHAVKWIALMKGKSRNVTAMAGIDVPPEDVLEGCRPRRPFEKITTFIRLVNIQK